MILSLLTRKIVETGFLRNGRRVDTLKQGCVPNQTDTQEVQDYSGEHICNEKKTFKTVD